MHYLDLLFGLAARGPRFFEDGWGDRALCEATDPAALARRPPARIDLSLGPSRPMAGGTLAEGSFTSPERRLPPCAREARVAVLLPARTPLRGVAVHLAASGDQGLAFRLRFAAPLLARGLGAIVLENPYYGARRPEKQARHALRSVSDLHLMGAATFQEARGLLRWAREALGAPMVGVTGYSMGGQLAAMTGAAMNEPVAIVPMAPSCSPDSVLRFGVMHHIVDLAALAGEEGTADGARVALLEHLARFAVTSLPRPYLPEAALVVGTQGDGVVPPGEMQRIAEHWGCELRWLPAGHVSAVIRHQGAMREALADAFLRLEAWQAARDRRREAVSRSSDRAPWRARGSARPARGASRSRA